MNANERFLVSVRSLTARVAVGPSTMRGQGEGAAASAREFLRSLRLRPFGTRDESVFHRALDRATGRLIDELPAPSKSWGLSRKVVNLFLRDCLYNVYLRREFELHKAEKFLEVPLDSVTGTWLRRKFEGTVHRRKFEGKVPPWPGVKHLTPEMSRHYQDAVAEAASSTKRARIHLDAEIWSLSRDNEK